MARASFGSRIRSHGQGKASTIRVRPSFRHSPATSAVISSVAVSTGAPMNTIVQTPSTPSARASSTVCSSVHSVFLSQSSR